VCQERVMLSVRRLKGTDMLSETNGNWTTTRRTARREGRAKAAASERGTHRVHAVPAPTPVRSAKAGLRRAVAVAAHQASPSPAPIWLAALSAASCQATRKGENHEVRWSCAAGRALYTNSGADTETIHPLGVRLEGGETLAVYWMPGETGYTMEVYGRNAACA
jgi:hypothetical protein